jgi:hypothetical protein
MFSVRRIVSSVILLLCIQCVASAQNVLVFPQFVTGADYVSAVTLVNTNGTATVTGTLSIFNQDGTPRSIAVDGKGTASSFSVTIPPGGTAVLNTTAGGNVVVGMAKFISDFPADGVVRYAYSGGQVGVLPGTPHSFQTLVINTANGNNTGLAIANPGTTAINVRLIQVDGNGTVVQTLDLPELNPLPANGQVAKFVTEFGFSSISNLSSGSIQIQTKGDGKFSALGLLVRNGAFATTGIIPGASGQLTPELFEGSYTGTWTNKTFGSTGGAFLSDGVITSTNTVLIQLTLTGNAFGAPNPPATLLAGTYTSSGLSLSGTSALFGPVTMTVGADGSWKLTANSVPGGVASTFQVNGTAGPEGFSGNYTVGLVGGGTAIGTISMTHSGH